METYGQCAWEACTTAAKSSYSASKSKYCVQHATEARDKFIANRDEQAAKRAKRYEAYAKLWAKATEVGIKAFEDAKPTPMVVQQHATLFDDSSEVVQSWNVPEGVCGFAWLTTRPGNSSFAHWAKKNLGASSTYGGGMRINLPVGRSSQSMARKEAAAYAMAKSLREGLEELGETKVKVYGHSRID